MLILSPYKTYHTESGVYFIQDPDPSLISSDKWQKFNLDFLKIKNMYIKNFKIKSLYMKKSKNKKFEQKNLKIKKITKFLYKLYFLPRNLFHEFLYPRVSGF